ncbi:MAG: PAS domain S-box protein, partial [Deltaproteobacteria bacterium]
MTPPSPVRIDPEILVKVLEQHREKIYQNWFTALRQEWTGEAQKKKKLSFFEQKIADGQDLLSLLLAYSGKTEAYYQYICSFTNLEFINSPKYSVLDVFDEAAALEDSILNLFQDLQFSEDERQSLSLMVHKEILGLVKALLCSTADLLASLVDGGMRGYCQVDDEGRIVCADQEFQDLLKRARSRKPEPGEHLEELFVESDRAFFAKAFADPEATPPGSQRLHLAAYQKAPIPVGTELCPIVMDGQRRSWYVCLVDLSALVEREKEVYESLPVGLVQVDLQGNFRYANRKFSEILGLEQHEWQGKDLWEFLLDEEAREKVKKGIMERREGKQGEYETKFTRKSGKEVPVQIYAVPERNLQKEIIGSFAIIRSLEQEKASARVQKAVTGMHELMAKEEKWDKMLDKVIQEAKPFILYDLCIVSEISPDQKHIRRLRALPPIKNGMSHMGRWETPDEMTRWLKEQRETLI